MAAELGMKLIPAHKVREMGLPALIETAIERVGDKPCFLTFDIDFIDPAYAPGTGTPEVGGFTSLEGLELVRALKDLNFVGFDIVEVLPNFMIMVKLPHILQLISYLNIFLFLHSRKKENNLS